jgi:GxxExxY protein
MGELPSNVYHANVTRIVIGAFYDVYTELGPGLAERAYSRALQKEFELRCETIRRESPMTIRYGSERLATFRPDFIIDDKVVVEIKARSRILKGHWAQLLTYLRVTGLRVGLLLNFGPRPSFKRLVR